MPSIQLWRRGRVARLGSAKAPTPVRIRTMPQKPSKQFGGFFMSNFYEKLIKDRVRIRPEASGDAYKTFKAIWRFFYVKFLGKIN